MKICGDLLLSLFAYYPHVGFPTPVSHHDLLLLMNCRQSVGVTSQHSHPLCLPRVDLLYWYAAYLPCSLHFRCVTTAPITSCISPCFSFRTAHPFGQSRRFILTMLAGAAGCQSRSWDRFIRLFLACAAGDAQHRRSPQPDSAFQVTPLSIAPAPLRSEIGTGPMERAHSARRKDHGDLNQHAGDGFCGW